MIKIYGASDDLIEVEGDVRDEFNCFNVISALLVQTDDGRQIVVRGEYCGPDHPDGWKLSPHPDQNVSDIVSLIRTDQDEDAHDIGLEIRARVVSVSRWNWPDSGKIEEIPSAVELGDWFTDYFSDREWRELSRTDLLAIHAIVTKRRK